MFAQSIVSTNVMNGMLLRRMSGAFVALAMLLHGVPSARPEEMPGQRFRAAAQEISRVLWLAETAAACGWAAEQEVLKFKRFSVRFVSSHSSHLSGHYKTALTSLITEPRYEAGIRASALATAAQNCSNNRWRLGWASYKEAADLNEGKF